MTGSELLRLKTSQRAMIAARNLGKYQSAAKVRQGVKSESKGGEARDFAGEDYGVSGSSVTFAKSVLEYGSAELIKACDDGLIPVSKAAKIAKSGIDVA